MLSVGFPRVWIQLNSWSQNDGSWKREAEQGSVHFSFELCRPSGVLVTSNGFRVGQTNSCEPLGDDLTILSLGALLCKGDDHTAVL